MQITFLINKGINMKTKRWIVGLLCALTAVLCAAAPVSVHAAGEGEALDASAVSDSDLPAQKTETAGDGNNELREPEYEEIQVVSDLEPMAPGQSVDPNWSADGDQQKVTKNDVPPALTGPTPFPRTTIGLGLGYTQLDDGITALDIIGLGLAGSFEVIPYRLSIMADLSMNIVTGDRSQFTFGHFGLGAQYTFYNDSPIVMAAGMNVRLLNTALNKVYSPDVFFMRPYYTLGIHVWRFSISPYVGVPIYADTNEDDDDDKYPDRWPYYAMDKNPFGLDYGIPIALLLAGGFYLTVEPSGVSWLYPDTATYLFVTPGLLYKSGVFTMGLGIRFRVYPETVNTYGLAADGSGGTSNEFWSIVVSAGVSF